ncbi:MAG: hypothetical protein K0S63_696, partial [Gammaproteobacteria bacterium]|nr:hypothetical protein [Gammaproteobacteria bacterium]
ACGAITLDENVILPQLTFLPQEYKYE